MIYNLIGSGILVAVGAIPVWAVMCLKLVDAQRQADCFASRADRLTADLRDRDATNSRLSDTVGQLQYKRDRALEQVTDGANATVVRMARILKGDA